jgi:hypothetical protein
MAEARVNSGLDGATGVLREGRDGGAALLYSGGGPLFKLRLEKEAVGAGDTAELRVAPRVDS